MDRTVDLTSHGDGVAMLVTGAEVYGVAAVQRHLVEAFGRMHTISLGPGGHFDDLRASPAGDRVHRVDGLSSWSADGGAVSVAASMPAMIRDARRTARALVPELQARNIRVVHVHWLPQAVVGTFLRRAGFTVVWHLHNSSAPGASAGARRRVNHKIAARGCDHLLAVSEYVADSWRQAGPDITVIHNGAEPLAEANDHGQSGGVESPTARSVAGAPTRSAGIGGEDAASAKPPDVERAGRQSEAMVLRPEPGSSSTPVEPNAVGSAGPTTAAGASKGENGERQKGRDPMGRTDAAIRCLSAGRLEPDKGHHVAIGAVAAAVERGFDVALDIAGGPMVESPYVKALLAQAQSAGLVADVEIPSPTDRVRLLGHVEDLRARHRDYHVGFQNRLSPEPCSVWVAEALVDGLPLIASANGGTPELVDDGTTGLLVKPDSIDEAAAALISLLENPKRRTAMADEARANQAERSLATQLQKTAELHQRLLRQ